MKISVQSQDLVDWLGSETAYRTIREAGFEAIDWNIDHSWNINDLRKAEKLEGLSLFEKTMPEILEDYSGELTQIRANNLTITQAHAPFPPYLPGREDILEYAIRIYRQIIRMCAAVGCRNLIIHGISIKVDDTALTPAHCRELNDRLYESLIPVLQEVKTVRVCLENLFTSYRTLGPCYREGVCSDPHEAVDMIDTYNRLAGEDYFGLCLDVGHLHLLRKNPHIYIPLLGKRIIALHLHDNAQDSDAHLAPFAGTVLWEEILDELKSAGYCGDLSFETFRQVQSARITSPELALPVLTQIAHTGMYFRSRLA